jgi:hypothetical protein
MIMSMNPEHTPFDILIALLRVEIAQKINARENMKVELHINGGVCKIVTSKFSKQTLFKTKQNKI